MFFSLSSFFGADVPTFTPPTVDEAPAGAGRLFGRYKLKRGVTVYSTDNGATWKQQRYPFQGDLVGDEGDLWFLGGHMYVIGDTRGTQLQTAGYYLGYKRFEFLPLADILNSGAPIAVATDYTSTVTDGTKDVIGGHSLSGTGQGDWWYFNTSLSPGFLVNGDFAISYDLILNPDGAKNAGGVPQRDIANFGFWINSPGATANGFMLRLQNNGGDGGFFRVTSGSHTVDKVLAGQRWTLPGPPSLNGNVGLADMPQQQWLTVRLEARGTQMAAWIFTAVRDTPGVAKTPTLLAHGTIDLAPYIDGSHTTSGTFGQKQDTFVPVGTAASHRWDNLYIEPHS